MGGRDGLSNVVGGPVVDLPLGPRRTRKRPPAPQKKRATSQKRLSSAQKRAAAAEKAVTAPEQDTAVVDDAPLLPQQPKKPRKGTSVASDAGHSPADIKSKHHIMKYDTHGKDGTYAVRLKGGQQFTEINIPNATLLQNQEVAEAICAELNKGVKPDTVRELMSILKEAMGNKICEG